MPLLYAQVKMALGRSHIRHYVVDIPSFTELISFCTDNHEVARTLALPACTLLTYSPIYDEIMSENHFCEDVEFLEEEVYHGHLTLEITRWLLRIMNQTHGLSPGIFGANVLKCDYGENRCEPFEIASAIIEKRFVYESMLKNSAECTSSEGVRQNPNEVSSFLFRNIFLRMPQTLSRKSGDFLIYERLKSHTGKTPKDAKLLAIKNGLEEATLDMNYYFNGQNVVFVGIESFTPLPVVSGLPIALASQENSWPWKFDLSAYKAQLLEETVRVNRLREQMSLSPFWT